jgi:predicted transcriptional regulator
MDEEKDYAGQPTWADKLRRGQVKMDIEDALPLWAIYTMMRKRKVSQLDVANHLGVSKQRVQAMLLEGEDSHERIESAITEISDTRHKATDGHETCESVACGVYLVGGEEAHKTKVLVNGLKESGWTDGFASPE